MTKLLDRETDPDAAAKAIAHTLAMREEARAALPALRAVAEQRAGEDGVRQVIARRFATFPQPERTEEEWAAWWADYVETLADLPLACLESAMRAWVASPDAEFMPKPGKLRDLAETTPSRALRRYQRCKRAVMMADGAAPLVLTPSRAPQPEEAEAIQRMFANFSAEMKAKAKPLYARKAELPSTAGKVDVGGLTAEMRARMAQTAGTAAEVAA